MRRRLVWALPLLAVACGSPEPAEPSSPEPVTSAGGETEVSGAAEEAPPLRTTIPVPVPQPPVAREALSAPLQASWTGIEEVVAIRPPDGPDQGSEEAIRLWAEGPLTEWIARRREATRAVGEVAAGVPAEPVYERAVGAALFGYALEDFAADLRSSPVPGSISEDPELLAIYVEALTTALRPLAIESATNYAVCRQRLASLGDDSEWVPWRAYCVQRGREVIEVYELQSDATEGHSSTDAAADPP